MDFTIKNTNDYSFVKAFVEVFYVQLPFSVIVSESSLTEDVSYREFPPPKLEQELLVSTSVLRI